MMFLVCLLNKFLDTNKRLLRTSSRVVLNTQHSKRKLISNRLNLPKVPLNTLTVKSTLPKAKNRLIYVGLDNCQANQAPSPFPKTVQGATLCRACANLKTKSCQSLIAISVSTLALSTCLLPIAVSKSTTPV